MSFLPSGSPAPQFSMTAAVSQRPFSLQNQANAVLLIFHSYQTARVAGNVVQAVRKTHPHPTEVLVANVADMRIVPRFLRGTAEKIIENAYKEASKHVPAGQNPADHIVILPDWQGAVFNDYKVPNTNEQVALVLINQARTIQGSYFGSKPEKAALDLLNGRQMA